MVISVDVVQAAARSVQVIAVVARSMWHAPRKIRGWRKRRLLVRERQQRDVVLGVVIPACAVTLVVALILASHIGSR